MYMTFRQMKADLARMQDALGLLDYVVTRINAEHGGNFNYSIQVGGDPGLIGLASGWETLSQYEQARAGIAGDDQIQAAIRMADGLLNDPQDTIASVLSPPGDRQAMASITTARAHMPSMFGAIEFALEVAEYAGDKAGRPIGVLNAYTGDRSQLGWVVYGSSLDDLASVDTVLESDPEYQAFYKRSEDVIVPGTLERHLWQSMS